MARSISLLYLCIVVFCIATYGQKMVVKTNLLYGTGMLTPNAGVELGLGRQTSLVISGGYNPWNRKGSENNNNKLVHWLGEAEFRYWLNEYFNKHFFGAHMLASQYNVGGYNIPLLFKKEYRYEGTAFGGGVSYGYLLPLNQHWKMEFTMGLGFAVLNYDKYNCQHCGSKIGNYETVYFGPTRAGISIVYLIR